MKSYSIAVYDIDTNDLIGVYENIREASNELFVSVRALQRYANNEVKEPLYKVEIISKFNGYKKYKILDTWNNDKIVYINKSAKELTKLLGCHHNTIYENNRNKTKLFGRYWVRLCTPKEIRECLISELTR